MGHPRPGKSERPAILPSQTLKQVTTLIEIWCGSSAPLPLGESGVSSVKGGSSGAQRCLDALYTETGRSPGIKTGNMNDGA